MPDRKNILNIARNVISIEKEAISQLESQLTEDFVDAVDLITSSNGRLIVAGVVIRRTNCSMEICPSSKSPASDFNCC